VDGSLRGVNKEPLELTAKRSIVVSVVTVPVWRDCPTACRMVSGC
jgi:hypothetical protein